MNGNMTQRIELSGTQRITYTQGWDIDNRIVVITSSLGYTATYAYDADGQRVKRVDTSGTLLIVGAHFEVQASTGISTSYYYFGSQRMAMRQGSAVYWLHGDHLGSASVTTNITGAVVSEMRYYPFGETRWVSGTLPTDRLFTGQRVEAGIGLYDYNARMYSPMLGRFISADTVVPRAGDSQAFNRYSYARNSPLVRIDPSGHADTCNPYLYNCGPVIPPPPPSNTPPAEAPTPVHPQPVPGGVAAFPYASDPTTPFQVGWEWLTGTGNRHHDFIGGDPFTELLKQHEHLHHVREVVAAHLRSGNYFPGKVNYDLSGVAGIPKYVKDYSTLATGGSTGNLAVTYLGSYLLDFSIVRVDTINGIAEVSFHVHNDSTIASATHPPLLGYTVWWEHNISDPMNAAFSQGPLSTTTQDFWWSEIVAFGNQP